MNTDSMTQFDTLSSETLVEIAGGKQMGMNPDHGGGSGGQSPTGGLSLNDIWNIIRRL